MGKKILSDEYPTLEILVDVCNMASVLSSHRCVQDIWVHIKYHLLYARKELSSLEKELNRKVEDTSRSRISEVMLLQKCKIHLGIVIALIMCPTAVDPMMKNKVEKQCFQYLVSCVIECTYFYGFFIYYTFGYHLYCPCNRHSHLSCSSTGIQN